MSDRGEDMVEPRILANVGEKGIAGKVLTPLVTMTDRSIQPQQSGRDVASH